MNSAILHLLRAFVREANPDSPKDGRSDPFYAAQFQKLWHQATGVTLSQQELEDALRDIS